MKDRSPVGLRPRSILVAIGRLDKCHCCDDAEHLVEIGTDIVCLRCWADYPMCNVLVWERAA